MSIHSSQPDFWLLLSVVLLLGIGTMMVFSASTASAYASSSSSTAYDILKSQIIWVVISMIPFLITFFLDYRFIGRFSIYIFLVSLGLLGLVLVIGKSINYAKRWIYIGPFSLQPSEIFKLATILFVAWVLSKPGLREKAVGLLGYLIYIIPIGIGFALLVLEPHMSCIIIVLVIVVSMMMAGKVKWYVYAVAVGLVGLAVLAIWIIKTKTDVDLGFVNKFYGYIFERIDTFKAGDNADEADSYQITQSVYAISSGGLLGRGFGKSVQKYLYLPEPYNDFIFSILAEELGFVGVTLVIVLFGVLIYRGYKISRHAPDLFGSLVAFGITTNVAVQTLLNMAVVSKMFPVTGVALPFFSYGGTSLIMMMTNMGILLNISRKSRYIKF